MYLLRRLASIIFLVLTFLIISASAVLARSGCCSWHGGVSHCASNGRYVCNDGTYSPTCTCGAPTYTYTPPAPPDIPSDTNGKWQLKENSSGGVDLYFDWDRPNSKSYSISLNSYAGANPGPLSDTLQSEFTFKDVKPGKRYINLKENMNGQWSKIVYWEVDIPENYRQIAMPMATPTPRSKPKSTPQPIANNSSESGMEDSLAAIALVAGVPAFIVWYGKEKKG